MNTRCLGKTGLEISEVGLGCWQFGGDFGAMSEELALEVLEKAVEGGVTFLDTADVYGAGVSEKIIGKFLQNLKGSKASKANSAKITVASKFGRRAEVYPDSYSKEKLISHVQDSIHRLGVQRLDLLQLHCIPFEILKQGNIFQWLRELKQDGLIGEFGASVESVEEGLFCMEQEGLASLQVIFNIFRQKLIGELFPTATQKGVGIIVRLPLASGLLSGKFTQETAFAPEDHRNFNRDGKFFNVGETFAGLEYGKGLELVEKIQPYVPKTMSMAQFSLRWILDHSCVSTVIPGASKVYQVESNISSSTLDPLPQETHKALTRLYETEIKKHIRGSY